MLLCLRVSEMAKDSLTVSGPLDRAFKTVVALFMVGILLMVPIFVAGNEDLQVVSQATGSNSNADLGWNITNVGDINGDGNTDYAFGAPGENRVYVFQGPIPQTFTMASANWRITGPSGSDFGWSVSGVEDYNRDGRDDLIVGSPGNDRAYIFNGRSSGTYSLTQSNAAIVLEGDDGDLFGHSVASIDYDNTTQIYAAVGAPRDEHFLSDIGRNVQTGAVFLFNLSYMHKGSVTTSNETLANFTFQGVDKNGWFGFTTVNLGDINTDGIEDLGIGDPYYNNTGSKDNGAFYIQNGKSIILEIPITDATRMNGRILGRNDSRFGWFAKSMEDVSQDGITDFIVGAPWESGPFPEEREIGFAHLFYGKSAQFDFQISTAPNTADAEFSGERPGDRFGWSAARTRISGTTDVVTIGAPGYDNGTKASAGGIFSFWNWGLSANISTANSKHYGDSAGDNLGYSVEEAYYRSEQPQFIRAMVSSPYFGTGNTGKIELLRRNQLPNVWQIAFSPPSGNMQTIFTISLNYTDPDGDAPEFVKVHVYRDQQLTEFLTTLDLDFSFGSSFQQRMIYDVQTTLPNSVIPTNPDNKLYFRATTQAVRGSRDIVWNADGTVPGPIVDGVAPSAADIYSAKGGRAENPDEGTFTVTFEWPEEDAGFNDPEGTVKRLHMALREGSGNVLTEENWNDTNPEAQFFNLSTGKTVFYRTFQFETLEKPFIVTRDLVIGDMGDLNSNPNQIRLKSMTDYSIALRAEDDEGNWGPISNVVNVESYWREPINPIPVIKTDIKDVPQDDGGQLNVTWSPPGLVHPEDLSYYWVFIGDDPLGDLDVITKEPDYNISRENDFDTFLNAYMVIDHYYDDQGDRVDLQDGSNYTVAMVGVNWLGEYGNPLEWSPQAKVINDNADPISKIRNVQGESHLNDGKHIRLTWDATNDPRFVEYRVYGQEYSFNDVNDAVELALIDDKSETELVIDAIGANAINQGKQYFFAVLVYDYNEKIDLELDNNNTAGPVKTIAEREEDDYPSQVRGVSLKDKGNDGGGVLQLTWFQLITPDLETTMDHYVQFWQYNVYFSDEPIVDVTSMEPVFRIDNYRTGSADLDNLDGEDLIDGKLYYAAVTMVDWDLIENPNLDQNNLDSAEPINQSDRIAPIHLVTGFGQVQNTTSSITIGWDVVTEEDVQDFNHYYIRWAGPKSGNTRIHERDSTTYQLTGLDRGSEYWINISVVDDNGNIGIATTSIRFETQGREMPPFNLSIEIMDLNENRTVMLDGDVKRIKEDIAYIVFFTGTAEDDYTTSITKLQFRWNITTPSGTFVERSIGSFDLDLSQPGDYIITMTVTDEAGLTSRPITITIEVEEEPGHNDGGYIWLILALILVFIIAVVVVLFVLMSGKRSQQSQMLEQYEERRKDIDTMEPIYTNLPTWTCDCGTTQVPLKENAYCNACYQSHEAVPIEGLDQYLKDHQLVLNEMKINVPPTWQGQDMAIENAKKDLEERKERALKGLNEEFAQWLKGTQYESEIPEDQGPTAMEGRPTQAALHPEGAIIPGQMPPPSQGQPVPMKPVPQGPIVPGQQIRPPMPPGQPTQPMPGPIRPPVPGQQPQRPPYPPQQQ